MRTRVGFADADLRLDGVPSSPPTGDRPLLSRGDDICLDIGGNAHLGGPGADRLLLRSEGLGCAGPPARGLLTAWLLGGLTPGRLASAPSAFGAEIIPPFGGKGGRAKEPSCASLASVFFRPAKCTGLKSSLTRAPMASKDAASFGAPSGGG